MVSQTVEHDTDIISENAEEGITQTTEATALETMVQHAAWGDDEALHTLCENIAVEVLFRNTIIIGSKKHALKATKEILNTIRNHINKLKNPKAFHTWLLRITIDETGKHEGASTHQDSKADGSNGHRSAAMDKLGKAPLFDAGQTDDPARIIMKTVGTFPQIQREVAVLHYYDDLDLEEIADMMDISDAEMSQIMKRSHSKLLTELERNGKSGQAGERNGMISHSALGDMLADALRQEAEAFKAAYADRIDAALSSGHDNGDFDDYDYGNNGGSITAKSKNGKPGPVKNTQIREAYPNEANSSELHLLDPDNLFSAIKNMTASSSKGKAGSSVLPEPITIPVIDDSELEIPQIPNWIIDQTGINAIEPLPKIKKPKPALDEDDDPERFASKVKNILSQPKIARTPYEAPPAKRKPGESLVDDESPDERPYRERPPQQRPAQERGRKDFTRQTERFADDDDDELPIEIPRNEKPGKGIFSKAPPRKAGSIVDKILSALPRMGKPGKGKPDREKASAMAGATAGTAAATAAIVPAVSKLTVGVIICAAATVVASAIAVTTVLLTNTPPAPPPNTQTVISIDGGIIFSGGIDHGEGIVYVNPAHAEPAASDSIGAGTTTLNWWITEAYNESILYQGDGSQLEDALIEMRDSSPEGLYILQFRIESATGQIYRMGRNFYIMPTGAQS